MESLGGFVDPSSDRPSTPTPASSSSSNHAPSSSDSTLTRQASTPAAASIGAMNDNTTLDLDKEVQNVIAGFGSFWGKVRKQSTAAFSNAEKQFESTRKDLNPLLSKAKANLDQFSTAARAEVQRLSEVQQPSNGGGGGGVVIGADGLPMIIGGGEDEEAEMRKREKGKGVDRSESSTATSTENPAAAASAFFSKLQSQLSSVQDQAPQALHALSSNFSQFQDQLSHLNLKNSTAEEYLHKGEHWLNEFKDEVSKLAKEAVQIVPPALSGQAAEEVWDSAPTKGMTRKDTLLYRLRSDPSTFLVDPSLPPLPSSTDSTDLRSSYASFLSTLPTDLLASDFVKDAQNDGGDLLESTRREVTSGEKVGEEEFWKRYLFRVHLIEEEEEKRKKVLSVAQSEDDDFSWDMDEEEANSPEIPRSSSFAPPPPKSPSTPSASQTAPTQSPLSHVQTKEPLSFDPEVEEDSTKERETTRQDETLTPTTNQSPRTSSSDETRTSYDLVGERSGNPSVDEREEVEEEASANGKVENVEAKKALQVANDEDDDSDWE